MNVAGSKKLSSAGKGPQPAAGKPSATQKRKAESGRSPGGGASGGKRPKQNRDAAQPSIKSFFAVSPAAKSGQPPHRGDVADQGEQGPAVDPCTLAAVARLSAVLPPRGSGEAIPAELPLLPPAVLSNSGLPPKGNTRPPRDSKHLLNSSSSAADAETTIAPAPACLSDAPRSVADGVTQEPDAELTDDAPVSVPASLSRLPPRPLGQPAGPARPEAPTDAVLYPLAEYEPVAHACWRAGEPTPYLHLARAFQVSHCGRDSHML